MLFQFFKLNLLTFLFESPRQILMLKVFLLSHGVWTWSSNSSWSLVVFVWLLSVPTIITGIKRARTVHGGSNLHLINLWSFGSIRTKHQLGRRELRQSVTMQSGLCEFCLWVYDICTEETFTIVLNRDALSIYLFFLICAIIYWYWW